MQLTATTPLALVLCLVILWLGPGRGLIALCAALPFGSAAAVNLSGLGSVFMAELAMLALCLSAVLRGARSRDVLHLMHPRHAGFPLLLLLVVTGIGAVFLPRINAGLTEVFTIVRQADGASIALRPLRPTGSNIGQFFRFALSGLAFVVVAVTVMRFATERRVWQALIVATCVHIGLALLDLLGPLLGVNLLAPFRNAYVAILDDQVLLGVRRLIGGFPEPSAFGIYTIGLFGFWLRIWFGTPRSLLANFMLLTLLALLIRSTSTAAYIGLVFYALLFLVWHLRRVARSGVSVVLYALLGFLVPALVGLSVLAYTFVPALSDFMNTIVLDKLNSTSGNERMAWNMQALRNFAETYGMGAGIGSVRASGWPFAVLGSVGALGAILYVWFLLSVFLVRMPASPSSSLHREVLVGLQSGCAAILLLACTILPQPNLGLAFFTMGGMVAGLALRHRNAMFERNTTKARERLFFHTSRV